MRVFVYGTLKSDYGNNAILRRGGARFEGPAVVADYKLLQGFGGGIPFSTPSEGSFVKGEVWDIGDDEQTLYSLDRLESHPRWYVRTPVRTTDGVDVSMYVMPPDRLGEHLVETPLNEDNQHEWIR